METNQTVDSSSQLFTYLCRVSQQPEPRLASTAMEMVDFIGWVEQEGCQVPAGMSIDQAMRFIVHYLNSHLPDRLRIVEHTMGYFVTDVAFLPFP